MGVDIVTLIDALKGLEKRARKSYAEHVSLDSDDFVEMMLLDGCFIIELLRKNCIKSLIKTDDLIFKGLWMIYSLKRDMLLLENQLPFFDILPGSKFSEISNGHKHLLDFVHKSWHYPKVKKGKHEDWGHIRCATELQEAGISFRKSKNPILFEITFQNGILEIPEIVIENRTESFLRNLIAYEQCSDVELLRRHGIIENTLGNDEVVAKMFNRMCNFVVISGEFRYLELFKKVNDHYHKRWNRWMAKLRSTYALISFMGVIILLLTLAQTYYSITDHQLALRLESSFNGLQKPSSECSIFKVPIQQRRENDNAYEPHMLAIGPYNLGNNRLQAMEVHKRIYLQLLLDRTKIDVRKLIDAMRDLEERARKSYVEPVRLDSDQFVEMMLLDGCFIVELLRKNSNVGLIEENDIIFKGTWMTYSLKRDMLLLENQLPFFVLLKVYDLTRIVDLQEPSLQEIIRKFFEDILPGSKFNEVNDGHKHLLGFVHRSWDHPQNVGTDNTHSWGHIRCATELQEAGITFVKLKKTNLFEIKFHDGILEIPEILIENRTESFLRNLIAYEQCSLYIIPIYIFDYVIVMDRLINSEKDVELLRRCGIIENTLGNDEVVAKMFNSMCTFVAISGPFHYSQLFKDVNKHCAKKWNYLKAKLSRDYFNTPWAWISFLAAVIILLLTLTQTNYAVLAYYNIHM
ncbi:hypothetical protein ACFE04_012941 [Oxalis oulophora]